MEFTVLLVDDDSNLLSGLVRAMHKQPFNIYTAHGADEAIKILKMHTIDVVISDERMPGMSGSDLLYWVSEHCPDVMRIMLTGHAQTDMAIRAINEAGVCYFFTKPCNEARLAVAIHKAMEERETHKAEKLALEAGREQIQRLEQSKRQLEIQTHLAFKDSQPPLERMEECCQELETRYRDKLPEAGQTLVSDAQYAASEVRQIIGQLEHLAPDKSDH